MAVKILTYDLMTDLTSLESAFKYIYENHIPPGDALLKLNTYQELKALLIPGSEDEIAFRSIISHLEDEESLPDEVFFSGMEDVFLNIHARYMPVYKHKNQFFNLQYVIRGELHEVVAGQELSFHVGDICFIAPETEHALAVFDDETVVVNILIKRETFRSVFINLLNQEDIISDFFSRVLLCNSYYPYIYCRSEIEKELTGRAEYIRFLNERYAQLGLGKYKKNAADTFDILMKHGNPKLAVR